jgi:hypothetical protein
MKKISDMKKILILVLGLILFSAVKPAFSQQNSITIGIVATECNQLIIQWNSTYNFVGVGKNKWTQATFTLTWPQAQGATVLGTLISMTPGLTGWVYNGAAVLVGSEYRREIVLPNGTWTQDIPTGITEILSIKLNTSSGTGSFTLANPNNNTDISSFNYAGQMWSLTFNPATVSGVPLTAGIKWNNNRWCGGNSTAYPGEPGTSDNTIACTIAGANGVLHQADAKVNALTINSGANLTIAPNASLTTYGVVSVNNANGLNIDANTTSTGSLITRSNTLTYGAGASSYVKQYFTDNVTTVPFHTHLVGPMVNDPAYETANAEKGVYLSAFNLVGSSTYAYVYDNLLTSPWVNVVPLTYPVPSTLGLALSTTTNASQFMNMTGRLITGSINTGNGPSVTNTGLNLISNPYPSGIDLFAFLGSNYNDNSLIDADVFVWEGASVENGGNYSNYNYVSQVGTGGLTSGILRIGQGFFIDYLGGGNVVFSLSHRVHANGILLKSDPANILRLFVRGNNFSDESVILFKTIGSGNFGSEDSPKWPSMYAEATESWTVTSDNQNVAINTLAPLGLDMVSVPMSFKCGTEGTYTIDAATIETFEAGTEIYLEDLKVGGEWYDLVQNPVYEFSGTPGDIHERFILHFFGPTAIDDTENGDIAQNAIKIYGWGQDAYIVNRGTETVKEYVAYDLMGRELHRGTLPNNTVNKVTIGNVSAYYIVKVITKEGRTYTDKVYITK